MTADPRTNPVTRRGVFNILQAGIAGCFACARVGACAQSTDPPPGHSSTEKADLTWEQVFRFAYQKDLIPLLNAIAEQVGRDQFLKMLRDAGDATVAKKNAGRPPMVRDLAMLAASLKNMPPLMQHALDAEVVEQTPEALDYKVNRCLWAKVFRDEKAADIGYAMVCYPDYAVAKALNPKMKLIRTQTLMQGADCCRFRYVMES